MKLLQLRHPKRTSRQAGLAYLAIFFSAIFANFFVLESQWVQGDAMATAQNIASDKKSFNWGVVAFAFTYLMDMILCYLLFILFQSAGKWLSAISSLMRFLYTYIFGIGIISLMKISLMDLNVIDGVADLVLARVETFNYYWVGGLILFGTHLGILGYLILSSSLAPKYIGVLLILAGLGYWIDGIAQYAMPNYLDYKGTFELIVIIPAVIGELALTLYLLIAGIRSNNLTKKLAFS